MLDGDGIFIDNQSYEVIWEKVILPTIKDYQNRFSEIFLSHNAKDKIWQEYVKFNKHCKINYMQDRNGKLDRHKVCACYMYAIVKANTLSCRLADSDTEQKYLNLNENLAITTGMSLLRAFVLSSINCNEEMPDIQKKELAIRIENGIVFPECNHGDYRDNFLSELHYANCERNYNILSLANTLFLLEVHTLQTEVVHKQVKKKSEKERRKRRK